MIRVRVRVRLGVRVRRKPPWLGSGIGLGLGIGSGLGHLRVVPQLQLHTELLQMALDVVDGHAVHAHGA